MVSKGRLGSEFTKKTIDKLRDDVGNHCSLCDCPTSGPSREPGKRTNLGTAAHITAAASGGPRYDESLTPAQRRSHENGIWCCRNCGKKVDDDASTYTVQNLRDTKRNAIERALRRVTTGRIAPDLTFDVAALRTRWNSELTAMDRLYDEVSEMAESVGGDIWSSYRHAATVWTEWDTPVWTTHKRQLAKVYGDRGWWSETSILYKRWNEARSAFRRKNPDRVMMRAAFAKREEALRAIAFVQDCLSIEAELETISDRDRADAIRVCEAGAKANSGTFQAFAESLGIKPDGLAVRLATAAWSSCASAPTAYQHAKAADLLRTGWTPTVDVMIRSAPSR